MCLLGLADWQQWYFFFFLHSPLSLPLQSHPCQTSLSVASHPSQSVPCGVKEDLREWQGHLRHGMKIRVIVLNRQTMSVSKPLGQMATVCQEYGQSLRVTRANSNIHKNTLNKYILYYNIVILHTTFIILKGEQKWTADWSCHASWVQK